MLERGTARTMDLDLADNLRYLAETLVPPKPGMIVRIATERLVSRGLVPEHAYERLSVPDWRAFCHSVWHAEVPGPCKLITRHLSSTGADEARFPDLPYCATALSARTRPVIEVDDDGLTQLAALHEIAHLLVDGDIPVGHRPRYIQKFVDLMSTWISPQVATDWYSRVDCRFAMGRRARGVAPGAAVCGSSYRDRDQNRRRRRSIEQRAICRQAPAKCASVGPRSTDEPLLSFGRMLSRGHIRSRSHVPSSGS